MGDGRFKFGLDEWAAGMARAMGSQWPAIMIDRPDHRPIAGVRKPPRSGWPDWRDDRPATTPKRCHGNKA